MKNHWSAPPAASERRDGACGDRRQHLVRGRRAGEQLDVQPLRAGREAPGARRRRRRPGRRRRLGRDLWHAAGARTDERHDDLVGERSLRPARRTAGPGRGASRRATRTPGPRTSCASVSMLSTLSRSTSSSLSPSASATYRGMRRRSRSRWTAANCRAPRGSRKAASSRSPRFQRARDRITRPLTTRGRNGACPSGPQSQRDPRDDLLVLQRAQEAVDAQTVPEVVVRGREPRDHLAPEPTGAEHDPLALDGHEQVGQWQLPVRGRAGASQVRDLVAAQHGPAQDVADPPLRQVHDLGDRRDPGGPPPRRPGAPGRAGRARSSAWQKRPSSARRTVPTPSAAPPGSHRARGPAHRRPRPRPPPRTRRAAAGYRRRRTAAASAASMVISPLRGGERAGELAEQERVAAGPRDGLVLVAAQRQPGQQWRVSAAGEPDRSNPMPFSSSSACASGTSRVS